MWVFALLACGGLEHDAMTASSPLLSIDRSVDRTPFEGAVTERVAAGGYAYLRVNERWVVGLDHGLTEGNLARVEPIGVAHQFHSARTGRTFDELWFAVARPVQ